MKAKFKSILVIIYLYAKCYIVFMLIEQRKLWQVSMIWSQKQPLQPEIKKEARNERHLILILKLQEML